MVHNHETWKWKKRSFVVRGEQPYLANRILETEIQFPKITYRLVAEAVLGRRLKKWELVHHVDGDRTNNRLENLAVLTRREHMLVHNGYPFEIMTLADTQGG